MAKPLKIEKIFAFVATGKDGDEGILGMSVGSMLMPMVGADEARMKSLAIHALNIGCSTGQPVKLLEFSGVKELNIMDLLKD